MFQQESKIIYTEDGSSKRHIWEEQERIQRDEKVKQKVKVELFKGTACAESESINDGDNHISSSCSKITAVDERKKILKEKKLCYNRT